MPSSAVGGVDSALVVTVAADALGADHVHALAMPSRYSSDGSLADATTLAQNLGIDLQTVAIEEAMRRCPDCSAPFSRPPTGLTDENLQSRIRGVLLMAVSNARGWIVLTTGNKSELATGYSTLYGDSAGGFAVIKDVPKLLVYRSVVTATPRPAPISYRRPSCPRPVGRAASDQRDDESLPPYEVSIPSSRPGGP